MSPGAHSAFTRITRNVRSFTNSRHTNHWLLAFYVYTSQPGGAVKAIWAEDFLIKFAQGNVLIGTKINTVLRSNARRRLKRGI